MLSAAVCFALSAGAGAGSGDLHQDPPTVLLMIGWPVFALAGGIVLDRQPGSTVGRLLTALALVPVVQVIWAAVATAGMPTAAELVDAAATLSGIEAFAVGIGIPWAVRGGLPFPAAPIAAVLAGLGALTVLLGARDVGWAVLAAGIVLTYVAVGVAVRLESRESRRRTTWLLLVLVVSGAAIGLAQALDLGVADLITCAALWLVALATAGLTFATQFRPLDEHALDLAIVLVTLVAGALVGSVVLVASSLAHIPAPGTSAAFSALATLALCVPAALWARRTILARRYGNGTISPADVAVITADLHAQTEPRDLLGKAARMVATASGSRDAQIVLGDEEPAVPENWVLHPLVVGGDRVGALLVESGRDPRVLSSGSSGWSRSCCPTVALVARAVGLAVEAEHARRDVARERDAERSRILGDLHDGLGPVLAGMSMRVQADAAHHARPEYAGLLNDLATDLPVAAPTCAGLVAGITPSILDDGDLAGALDRLVGRFAERRRWPRPDPRARSSVVLPSEVQVAVYRCVAEGVTNALRHARATHIDVRVRRRRATASRSTSSTTEQAGRRRRASGSRRCTAAPHVLGGCLEVTPAVPRGTHLHVRAARTPGVAS